MLKCQNIHESNEIQKSFACTMLQAHTFHAKHKSLCACYTLHMLHVTDNTYKQLHLSF